MDSLGFFFLRKSVDKEVIINAKNELYLVKRYVAMDPTHLKRHYFPAVMAVFRSRVVARSNTKWCHLNNKWYAKGINY